MRISFHQLQSQGVGNIMRRQLDVARTQLQLATGHKLQRPADDPAGSARLLRVREQIAAAEQYQRNITLAGNRLGSAESALDESGNVLKRAMELAVQGANDTLSVDDRRSIAQEVRELRSQLLDLANTRDGSGEYLFAGFKTETLPFVLAANGSVSYQGDQGQRLVQVGPVRQVAVSDSGFEVFQSIRTGNGRFSVAQDSANTGNGVIDAGSVTDSAAFQGHSYRIEFTAATTFDVIDTTTGSAVLTGQSYADGQAIAFAGMQTAIGGAPAAGDKFFIEPSGRQDLFASLNELATALEAPSATAAERAEQRQGLNNSINHLEQGLDRLLAVRGRIGARVNGLEGQEQANAEFVIRMEAIRDDIDGLNYAEAASRLSEELLVLQAAQQSYLRIQNLSLFNYMR